MDRRFESRLDEMMEQAEVSPELLRGLLPRLSQFLEPFLESLREPEQKQHAVEYTTGLMSGLEHKTGEGIAYLYDQDRQGIQKFIGQVPWDHQPLLRTLAAQVGEELGRIGWCDRVRPLGISQERRQVGGRRQAMVRSPRQG